MKGFRGLLQKSVLIDLGLCLLILYLLYIASRSDDLFNEKALYASIKRVDNFRISKDVLEKLKSLEDVRSKKCKRTDYFNDEKVTLISYFHNYQLYDLKVALLTATDELIGQVVIVDDGSTEEAAIKEAEVFFDNFHTPVVLLRNEVRKGVEGVLKRALQRAFYDAIVFIDTTVVCNKGWLPPLLQQLTSEPNSIAVSHLDKVTVHPIYYIPIEQHYVASLMWNLNTVLKIRNTKDMNSPGLKPDIFAFRKSMLKSIGMLDWNFGLGGGGVAELAIRVWACGKSIKLVECSRVGLMGFDRPFKITSGHNLIQFVGVWFDDNHYKPYSALMASDGQQENINVRRQYIFNDLKCKGIQWYFKNLSKKRFNIEMNAIKIGNLKVGSGSCASVAEDSKINLKACDDFSEVNPEDAFQLTSNKHLISKGMCLTATTNAYIILEECREGDRLQAWEYTITSRLFNLATKMCACHVTDPNKDSPDRQVVMVQPCEDKELERFRMWTFLPI